MFTGKALEEIDKYLENRKREGHYIPYLTVHSARKYSRRSLIHGIKSNRLHHLLSDGESYLFQINESLTTTLNIFEQTPLMDLEKAMEAADTLNVRYPKDKQNNVHVMSTDQLVEIGDGSTGTSYLEAHTFKYASSLHESKNKKRNTKRTLEKLAIEKLYWSFFNIKYVVQTEYNTSRVVAENLAWARTSFYHKDLFIDRLDLFLAHLLDLWQRKPCQKANLLIDAAGHATGLDRSSAFNAFMYAAWSRRLPLDLSKVINLEIPLQFSSIESRS